MIAMHGNLNIAGDWKYPNTVDMTLYKKDTIRVLSSHCITIIQATWKAHGLFQNMLITIR